ncbi:MULTISPECIES: hypothetical protein [unclassified Nitratiruptor]|uniref:hypothetical protein n=1 Tax=unclassified Nitratiruptor TaxID=2624044 RepID=UPI001915A38B|nr:MULTISPECIES: hypothetical protein [unclassified Nitratiruptor]BCD60900.1 hypothetical protein NitYY0810_C1678 [Nitratiruptor sp. YY08-10]BCD64832.1 hypothetical protein NitYY0814_C1686 [Nitratiruptor sp. YY08-14]
MNSENFFQHVKASLEKEVKRFECIGSRYNMSYCILLIYHESQDDVSHLVLSNIRCADSFMKIDEHHYAVVFFSNREDSYSILSNKLMYSIESESKGKTSIGAACSNFEDNVVLAAVQNLLEAKSLDYNIIID